MTSQHRIILISLLSGFLTACGSADQSGMSSIEKQYIASCKASSVSEDKCQCIMGVYKEIGLDLEKFSDSQLGLIASHKLTPEASQKVAQCMLDGQ